MKAIKKTILVISLFFIVFNLIFISSNLSKQKTFFITGMVGTTQIGTTSVNITGVVSISLTTSLINFGSGYVNASSSSCTMNSENFSESIGCVGFSDPGSGFILENDGNVNVSITLNSTIASDLIGGTNSLYQFKSSNSEANSCSSGLVNSYTNITALPQAVCTNFLYGDLLDTIEININVKVPDDANVGFRNTNVTFTATEV